MAAIGNMITPFDLYFAAGLGLTSTNARFSEPTVHLGTGQIFAINKSLAFRWDFSWNFYSARNTVTSDLSNQNNLFMSMGASFFFPEAKYR
jgi:outer membrane beta-barrel protein